MMMEMNAFGAMLYALLQVNSIETIISNIHILQHSVCLLVILAGAISSAIATPTDVLKVRMQVHGRAMDQVGLIGCFQEIYRNEGISGLWRVSISL